MSPPCNAFTAEQLPSFVQANVYGKKRKVEGGGNVDLLKCPLREFSQYRCRVENPRDPNCPVRCKTVVRFFREYVEILDEFGCVQRGEAVCCWSIVLMGGCVQVSGQEGDFSC
jgi:export protein Som1